MNQNQLQYKNDYLLLSSDYDVDIKTDVPLTNRKNTPHNPMPESPPNGGLYGGPVSNKPWMPIPITPTATNYVSQNLLSADPPPGAMTQFVGTNRMGNNYTAMPGVKWYNSGSPQNKGPFNLKVTK